MRKQKKLSLRTLVTKSGVSYGTLQKLESFPTRTTRPIIEKVALALGTTYADLVAYEQLFIVCDELDEGRRLLVLRYAESELAHQREAEKKRQSLATASDPKSTGTEATRSTRRKS